MEDGVFRSYHVSFHSCCVVLPTLYELFCRLWANQSGTPARTSCLHARRCPLRTHGPRAYHTHSTMAAHIMAAPRPPPIGVVAAADHDAFSHSSAEEGWRAGQRWRRNLDQPPPNNNGSDSS